MMFKRSGDLEPSKVKAQSRQLVATESMLDVESATSVSDGAETGRPSFLLKLELTSYGPKREYATSRNQLGTNIVVPVEGKDMMAFQNLIGRRILLTQPTWQTPVATQELEAEVSRLKEELLQTRERLDMLQSNYLTLVEESRKLT
jgi:hypothetical protein